MRIIRSEAGQAGQAGQHLEKLPDQDWWSSIKDPQGSLDHTKQAKNAHSIYVKDPDLQNKVPSSSISDHKQPAPDELQITIDDRQLGPSKEPDLNPKQSKWPKNEHFTWLEDPDRGNKVPQITPMIVN